ncbi:MAG: response regulator [Flammeovirgaceae bacterium]
MNMAKAKILVVDDDPLQLEVIMRIVEREEPNYEIFQANNGAFALKIAQLELPDIIITDWEMPTMNGIELMRQLKKSPETQDIPVIMCSGVMVSSDHLKTALEAGAADYIRKPVDSIELVARMRSMIELSRSYKEIKHLNQSKNEILSVIAHDLRGPVANLNQAVKMVLSQKLEGEFLYQFMELIEPQLHANYSLLNNLLLWARNLRDNIAFQPEKVELKSLVDETFLLEQSKAQHKEIELNNGLNELIYVNADKNMVSTILRNLVANALKFTPRSGIISIDAKSDENRLKILVKDTGVGMSDKQIEQLFNPKVTASTVGTENEKGTGLGLLLCQEFIKKHHSQLQIDSEVGKGTCFSFHLPLIK